MFVVARAVPSDPLLSNIDAESERTVYPADLLWGPGGRKDAIAWLHSDKPAGDKVTYLDRLFVIRQVDGQVDMPIRPEQLSHHSNDRRNGIWHLLRADFPGNAISHVQHMAGPSCRTDEQFGGCAVEEISEGTWRDALAELSASPTSRRPPAI